MWRKTRKPIMNHSTGQTCYGIDGNRNYGHMWRGGDDVNLAKIFFYCGFNLKLSLCSHVMKIIRALDHFPSQKPKLFAPFSNDMAVTSRFMSVCIRTER